MSGEVGRPSIEDRFGPRTVAALRQLAELCADAAEIVEHGRDSFLSDMILQRAAEATIARIGETVRNRLPPALLEEFPGQPWSLIVALRVRVVHVYDSLDYDMVWQTLTDSIPALRHYIETEMLGDRGGPASDRPREVPRASTWCRRVRPSR